MKTLLLPLSLAAALCASAAHAQTAAPVAQPSSPAPIVVNAPAPAADPTAAPVVVVPSANPVPAPAAPTNVTQIVYTPKLPTAEELTAAAAAQSYTVEKLVQTSSQVIAFYRNAGGQPVTVAYQSLPPTGAVPATTPAPARVVVTSPPPAVVYRPAPRVVYYEDVYPTYYYPRAYYPPVSLHLGFGFRSYHGGGHRGHGRW